MAGPDMTSKGSGSGMGWRKGSAALPDFLTDLRDDDAQVDSPVASSIVYLSMAHEPDGFWKSSRQVCEESLY